MKLNKICSDRMGVELNGKSYLLCKLGTRYHWEITTHYFNNKPLAFYAFAIAFDNHPVIEPFTHNSIKSITFGELNEDSANNHYYPCKVELIHDLSTYLRVRRARSPTKQALLPELRIVET